MSDPNFSAIRATLQFESIDEFIEGYGRYISRGGMFVPMAANKLKPVGTTVRFQYRLADGTTAMLGEAVVRQLKGLENQDDTGPVGMLVKFSKLSADTKQLVDRIVEKKSTDKAEQQQQPQQPRTPEADQPDTEDGSSDDYDGDTGVLSPEETEDLRSSSGGYDQIPPEQSSQQSDADLDPGSTVPGDQSEQVAAALAQDSEPEEDAETRQQQQTAEIDAISEEQVAASGPTPSEQQDDEEFATPFPAEQTDEPDADASPQQQPDAQPDPQPESSEEQPEQDQPEEDSGPQAITETEGGLKVMAFDENEEIDESAAQELEEFADIQGDDEIDAMFDNVFGGGGEDDGGGLFGGGGDADDADPFGGGGDEVADDPFGDVEAQQEAEQPEPVAEAEQPQQEAEEPQPEAEQPEPVFEAEEPEPVFEAEEPEPVAEASQPQPEVEEPEPVAETPQPTAEFEEPEPVAEEPALEPQQQDEPEGDSSEDIQALLAMDDEDEDEPEMSLNLSGGRIEEEEESEADDDPDPDADDSMESLLASAQQELESKKEQDKEEEEKDILDELIGDDELPPPSSGVSAFDVPQPEKKKKGFISKLFGKDD